MNHLNSSTHSQRNNIEIRRGPFVLSDVDVERIAAAAESAQSPSTRRTYGSAWRQFTRWAQDRGYHSLSAESAAVVAYLVDRGETVKPATRAVIAAAIGYYHRAHSLANPAG